MNKPKRLGVRFRDVVVGIVLPRFQNGMIRALENDTRFLPNAKGRQGSEKKEQKKNDPNGSKRAWMRKKTSWWLGSNAHMKYSFPVRRSIKVLTVYGQSSRSTCALLSIWLISSSNVQQRRVPGGSQGMMSGSSCMGIVRKKLQAKQHPRVSKTKKSPNHRTQNLVQ